MKVRVALLADRGRASRAPQHFFRSEEFLAAEGVTHTLMVCAAGSWLAVPLIVRQIPGDQGWDATSPYGYPGGSLRGDIPELHEVDLSGLGLVSIFIRDRIDSTTLHNERTRSQVFVHDPMRPRRIRRSVSQVIVRNAARGYYSEAIPGRDVDQETLEEFARCYRQTMRRNSASRRYFFPEAYLRSCLSSDETWLILTRCTTSASLAAAALVVHSDGYLHHYLGCTADAHVAASPSKNTCSAVLDLADRMKLPVNLGGGVAPGDGIEYFKRGFANSSTYFITHEFVCDPTLYATLVEAHEKPYKGPDEARFFPLYRT
jgi:hypothetical protein